MQIKDPNESYVNDNFTLVNYPWLLDAQSKSEVLLMDYRERMKSEIDKELIASVFANPFQQNLNNDFAYLQFDVRRDMLVEDALNSLVKEGLNFRKPLRVKFVGEPGVDEGGV